VKRQPTPELEHRWWCNRCKEGYEVNPLDPQYSLLTPVMRCPKFSVCGGYLQRRGKKRVNVVKNWKVFPVKAHDLWLATQGFGLVGERKCSPARLLKLMTSRIIAGAELEPAGPGGSMRTIIKTLSIHTDDGIKVLHFASSSKGATIYKVTDG
jgi:hypothetical protein